MTPKDTSPLYGHPGIMKSLGPNFGKMAPDPTVPRRWKITFHDWRGQKRTVYTRVSTYEDAEAVAEIVCIIHRRTLNGVLANTSGTCAYSLSVPIVKRDGLTEDDDCAVTFEQVVLWALGRENT